MNGVEGYRKASFQKDYRVLPDVKHYIGFFVRGHEYKFLGFLRTDRHLIGFADPEVYEKRAALFILGSDKLGRDQFSRLLLATRISLSIGLVGVAVSLIMGVVIGGISGYYGGRVDLVIQRIIELIIGIPVLPMWMALSAAVPRTWDMIQVYLALTVILSILGWTGIARVVRGRYLSLREEEFVMAASVAGSSKIRIMFRHMLPSFYSHLIAQTTLAIPSMIIGETALSFLGLGLRSPAVSYGVMLQQAQNVQTVALYPWLMMVAIPVTIIVLSFNFLGDGLRNAADPYG
jgi:peptide/nickel transport system permease protein